MRNCCRNCSTRHDAFSFVRRVSGAYLCLVLLYEVGHHNTVYFILYGLGCQELLYYRGVSQRSRSYNFVTRIVPVSTAIVYTRSFTPSRQQQSHTVIRRLRSMHP